MARARLPRNLAVGDQLEALLRESWPSALTARELADALGARRTTSARCPGGRACREVYARDTADSLGLRFVGHHAGNDVWTYPLGAVDVGAMLRRLAGLGLVNRYDPADRTVLWSWGSKPMNAGVAVGDFLEACWALPERAS